jgi:SanA protein
MRVAQHLFSQEDLPPAQAVIVLGAKVYSDGRLSLAVQQRADAAFLLRKSGKAKKILVSGDNRTKWYDEVTTIKNYLLKRGVPDSAIFLDYAGLDTYDSMYRAQYIFQVSSLLIPTQNFHIVRSVYIARALGIEASGR